ncbi:glycogen debranching protein GlgX [Shewanella waksmanii]|uniref:glycogen debranching protein GlgX n=1 Tax=Shewanella waksmanii TaxID=213783 RepID=UPI0005691724|nr:glycogen debranching protein GlgX [Shewanella waksmanii]
MRLTKMLVTPGRPYPLGASVDDSGVNFALFSAHATAVYLCVYDASGVNELARVALPRQSDHIWHGHIEGLALDCCYGYRVDGPYQPELGHRFNVNKLLLDPYAKLLLGELVDHPSHYAYQQQHPDADLSFCSLDSGDFMPKCKIVDTRNLSPIPAVAKEYDQTQPSLSLRRSIIYEMHVKGFTQLFPDLTEAERGRFSGIANANVVQYIKNLGVTAVELLPVQQFASEPFLQQKQLSNYWGYNSIGFFAPHQAYLNNADINEFRQMVAALHQSGIEVLLDVVYNHTAEGDCRGPSLCFRGIDNLSYYRLHPQQPRYYINDTGCGNSVDLSNPHVLRLVMDSLRYWVEVMGVDGFRFDLAATLGREPQGFNVNSSFFDAIKQDPVLSQVRLIAEPWDIGPGGYQLGHFPMGWSEWNDRYRDTVRRFWRGDAGMLPEFARRFHGSSDLFEHAGRRPSASINFITSHDGFTLTDLVSYRQRHNDANGEQSRDGHQENFSDNCGMEGVSQDLHIQALRTRQSRNMLTTLLLSQGVPMLLAGDELGHSQQGNNNAYCQDNTTTWLSWQQDIQRDEQLQFTRRLIKLRQRFPLLCHREYIHDSCTTGSPALDWFCRQGSPMTKTLWSEAQTRTLSVVISGELEAQPQCRQALLLMLNADDESLHFTLPTISGISHWDCLIHTQDSGFDSETKGYFAGGAAKQFLLQSKSLMVFYAQFEGAN